MARVPRKLGALRASGGVVIALAVALGPLGAGYALTAQGQSDHGQGQGNHGHGHEQDDHGDQDHGHWKHGRWQEEDAQGDQDQGNRRHHSYYFGERESRIIRSYYGERGSGLPPGLAKRGGNLPPGLEKHLERDGTLPPGLQKRLAPLPYSLRRELPPLPRGCDCRIGALGRDVLIVNEKTNRILDIVRDVRDVIGR